MENKRLTAARIVMTVLSVAAVGFIFGNSLLDADDSSLESGRVLELIDRLLSSFGIDFTLNDFMVRKAAHFTEFALLGALLAITVYLYLHKRLKSFLLPVAMGGTVAVCDELLQTLSQGRSCEVRDMLIDFSGVVFAALIVALIIKARYKKKCKEG